MRRRYLEEGPDGFAKHELLEMLLYGTIPRGDTNEIAHHLLDEFGSLSNLIEADPMEIAKSSGIGIKSAVFLSLLHELVRRYEEERMEEKPALTSISRSVEYCTKLLAFRPAERFYIVCLDARRQVLHTAKIAEGTVGSVMISPRQVVEKVLRYQAMSVILCHNHPRGSARPSNEDNRMTTELRSALRPLGVAVVDHIIVGENSYFSYFENGMLKEEKKGGIPDE